MSLYHGGQQPPHDPTVPPDISQQQWGAPAGAVADAAAHAVHQLQQQQQQQQQLPGVPNVPHFPAGPGQGGANSVAAAAAAAAAAVAAPAPAGLSTIAAAAQQAYSTYNPNAQYVQHPPSWQTQQPRPPQLVPPQQSQAQQPQPQQQLFICPQCNKGLKSQAGLTSHMQHCDPEKIRAEASRNPQERALKISTKRREQWESRFDELRRFHAQHRHCRVASNSKESAALGRWVSAIRREYKKRERGDKNQLTDERILKLVELGFDFHVHDTNWDQKYRELMDFKNRHGHADVPMKYEDNQPLAIWCQRQRLAFQKRQENGKGGITDDRVEALQSLGFTWTAHVPTIRGKNVRWEDRMDQMREYKAKHGHLRVARDDEKLGNFVALCRFNYRHNVKVLTDDKRRQLEELGFEWRLRERKAVPITKQEREKRRKKRQEDEIRRQINREVKKRKEGVPATKRRKLANSGSDKKVRTYRGHVPRPSEDGGPPQIPVLPPDEWISASREEKIASAKRAAEYYARIAERWHEIAKEEEDQGIDCNKGDGMGNASEHSEAVPANESGANGASWDLVV